MMPANTYTKARTADYFDNLLADPNGGIQKLFRKFAVHAADNSVGYTVATTGIRNRYHKGDFEQGAVLDAKLVSWVHLEKLARTGAAREEGFDTVYLEVSINPRPNWLPCYFLPWKPQSMVHMTIPRKGTRVGGPPPPPDPDIFFTAAINGCSVFIQGSPNNPTIYHCGGTPDYPSTVPDPNVAATFWRNLVINYGQPGGLAAEVNKTHYVLDVTTTRAEDKSTRHSREYEEWLKSDTGDTVRIKQVKPWGCVFGIRTGTDWKIYLQENATIEYATIQKKRIALGPLKRKVEVDIREVGRPMHVREIFPDGNAVVNFSPMQPITKL